MSDENITVPTTTDYSLNPQLIYSSAKTRAEFEGSCLKQDQTTYNHGKLVNIYIVYDISKNYDISSYSALEHCLFDGVALTKNSDIYKYKYSAFGIGFDKKGVFFIPWWWNR